MSSFKVHNLYARPKQLAQQAGNMSGWHADTCQMPRHNPLQVTVHDFSDCNPQKLFVTTRQMFELIKKPGCLLEEN